MQNAECRMQNAELAEPRTPEARFTIDARSAQITCRVAQGRDHLGGIPVGVTRPEQGGQAGGLWGGRGRAGKRPVAQRRGEGNQRGEVGLGPACRGAAGAVGVTAASGIDCPDGLHFLAICGKRNAALGRARRQAAGAEDPGARPEYYADGGFVYRINNNFQLDIRAGIGLNRYADDFFAGSGFAVRY